MIYHTGMVAQNSYTYGSHSESSTAFGPRTNSVGISGWEYRTSYIPSFGSLPRSPTNETGERRQQHASAAMPSTATAGDRSSSSSSSSKRHKDGDSNNSIPPPGSYHHPGYGHNMPLQQQRYQHAPSPSWYGGPPPPL